VGAKPSRPATVLPLKTNQAAGDNGA